MGCVPESSCFSGFTGIGAALLCGSSVSVAHSSGGQLVAAAAAAAAAVGRAASQSIVRLSHGGQRAGRSAGSVSAHPLVLVLEAPPPQAPGGRQPAAGGEQDSRPGGGR